MQNVQVSSPVIALVAQAERRADRNWRRGSTCWTTDSSVLLPQRGLRPRHRVGRRHRLGRFRDLTVGLSSSRRVDLRGHRSARYSATRSLCPRSVKTKNTLQTQSLNPIPQSRQKLLRATHR